jgi:hypothetical protein
MIMGNGVIIPPHDFKQRPRWYKKVQEVTKYEFGADTCGSSYQITLKPLKKSSFLMRRWISQA